MLQILFALLGPPPGRSAVSVKSALLKGKLFSKTVYAHIQIDAYYASTTLL